MPIITSCHSCSKKLRVPDDLLGKKVKCPGCGTMFTAQTEPEELEPIPNIQPSRSTKLTDRQSSGSGRKQEVEELEIIEELPRRRRRDRDDDDEDEDRPRSRRRDRDEDDEDDRPRSRRRRDDDDEDDDDDDDRPRAGKSAWTGTRFGLNLVILGGYLGLAVLGLYMIGAGIAMLMGSTFTDRIFAAMIGRGGPVDLSTLFASLGFMAFVLSILALLGFGSFLMSFGGQAMCVQVPSNRGSSTKTLAIANVVCQGLAYVLVLVFYLLILNSPGSFLFGIVFLGISGLLLLAAFVCWIMFLRGVCDDLRAREMAGKVMSFFYGYLLFIGISFVVSLAVGCAGGMLLTSVPMLSIILMSLLNIAVYGGSIAMLIWLLFTTQGVRDVVDRRGIKAG